MKNTYKCYVVEQVANDPLDPKIMPIGSVLCSAYTFAEAEQLAKTVVSIPCVVWCIKRVTRQNPARKPYFMPYTPETED